jgi:hypothetical protein
MRLSALERRNIREAEVGSLGLGTGGGPRLFTGAMQREPIIRPWGAEDDDRLRSFWALPLYPRSIAMRMRRSKETVMKKAREMGLRPKTFDAKNVQKDRLTR